MQFSCHSVAVVLTPVQTKQIRINIHKRNNTKTQYKQYKTQSIQVHILPKHPHNYQNTHTITKTPTQSPKHSHNHQNTHTITKTPTQLPKHLHNYQNTHTITKTLTQLPKHPHNCQNTHTITKTPTQLPKHPHITTLISWEPVSFSRSTLLHGVRKFFGFFNLLLLSLFVTNIVSSSVLGPYLALPIYSHRVAITSQSHRSRVLCESGLGVPKTLPFITHTCL